MYGCGKGNKGVKGTTYKSNINTSDTASTITLDGGDHLIDNFTRIRLRTD